MLRAPAPLWKLSLQATTLRHDVPGLENNAQTCPTTSIVTPVPGVVALEHGVLHMPQSRLLGVPQEGQGQKSVVHALGSTGVFYAVPAFQRDIHPGINPNSPCGQKQSERQPGIAI